MPENAGHEPIVILHLSDLHFGEHSRFAGKNHRRLGERFGRAVKEEAQRQEVPPAPHLVIVTGDVAETARPDEYKDRALPFFNGLKGELGIKPECFVFLPGNHDVSWFDCESEELRLKKLKRKYDPNAPEARKALDKVKFSDFDAFVTEFCGKPRGAQGESLACGATLHLFDELGVAIAAMNSCEQESHREKDHVGKLSEDQTQALMDRWHRSGEERWLKVVALHHNPIANTPENVQEWFDYLERIAKEGKLDLDVVHRFASGVLGADGRNMVKRVAAQCQAQLVLHGHHHSRQHESWDWHKDEEGRAYVLSAGSMGLAPEKLPKDQPNRIQLVTLDPPKEQLRAFFLRYDPLEDADGFVTPGTAVGEATPYEKTLYLPKGYPAKSRRRRRRERKPDTSGFLGEYRRAMSGLYGNYEFRGATQAGGAGPPLTSTLEGMYEPLRMAEGYDINEVDKGKEITPKALRLRRRPLAIRGQPGSGKTTWMRYTFRKLLHDDKAKALPIMIELRRLVAFWGKTALKGEERSLQAYIEDWVGEHLGRGWQARLSELLNPEALKQAGGPRVVLLVDGWDELGDLGPELHDKLMGFMKDREPMLVVVSSRPYGEGRPADVDGFDLTDIQPLDDKQIGRIAKNFFEQCYREEPTRVQDSIDKFMAALAGSDEAHALARTALLLTMMLLISRSAPLPDKRHLLYDECVKNLLTALPDQLESDVAGIPSYRWRPPDGEARRRAAAELAYRMQTAGYEKRRREPIVLERDGMLKLLAEQPWTAQDREGFLNWLTARAGLLVERADNTLCFAHLSFQEYLTAWHLDSTIQGDKARKNAFIDKCSDANWWETLRLWAAQVQGRNPEWLQKVVEALEAHPAGVSLVGAMMADGLAADEVFKKWAACVPSHFEREWPDHADACAQAWAASRQKDRRDYLAAFMDWCGERTTWTHYARYAEWVRDAVAAELPAPPGTGNAAALIRATRQDQLDEPMSAVGRVLCGGPPFWPGGNEAAFLNLWPARRRLAGLRLQAVANLALDPSAVRAIAPSALAPPVFDEEAEQLARYFVRDFGRDFGRDFARRRAASCTRGGGWLRPHYWPTRRTCPICPRPTCWRPRAACISTQRPAGVR